MVGALVAAYMAILKQSEAPALVSLAVATCAAMMMVGVSPASLGYSVRGFLMGVLGGRASDGAGSDKERTS